MMMNSSKKHLNNRGFIAADFLFAFVLVIGISSVLFALTFTLAITEVTQYITFSSARSYMAAHKEPSDQVTQGQLKYTSLKTHPVFAPIYGNGWFEIAAPESVVGKHSGTSEGGYEDTSRDYYNFYGVSTFFKAPVLNITVPMYGSTQTEDRKDGFKTVVGSFLGREPSQAECESFVNRRWEAILNLGYSIPSNSGAQFIVDNGC